MEQKFTDLILGMRDNGTSIGGGTAGSPELETALELQGGIDGFKPKQGSGITMAPTF